MTGLSEFFQTVSFARSFLRQALRIRRGGIVPFFATMFITSHCTNTCQGCFFYKEFPLDRLHMDPEIALQCAAQLGQIGVPVCYVVGGEPLLHPAVF